MREWGFDQCSKKSAKSRRHSQKNNQNNQLPGGTGLKEEITEVPSQFVKQQQGMAQTAARGDLKGRSIREVEVGIKAG